MFVRKDHSGPPPSEGSTTGADPARARTLTDAALPIESPTDTSDLPTTGSLYPRTLRDWALPALALVVGAVMSVLAFGALRSRERATRRFEFERRASQVALSVKSAFDIPLEVVNSIPALFAASSDVNRAEFRAFTRHALARYPWIYALEWIPRVPGNRRAELEAAAVADGMAGFHFKQDAPPGLPVRAAERPEYFPLYFMEPPNPIALGLEETALEARRLAMEAARDLDATVVTQRLKLVQDEDSIVSVIAFHPIYSTPDPPKSVEERRATLRGFAAAVFRLQPVVSKVLAGVDMEKLDVVLVDTDAKPEAVLYESRTGAALAVAGRGSEVSVHPLEIAGRRWVVRVGDRARWLASASEAAWPALGIGLVATMLATAFAYAWQTVRRLRRHVRIARRLGQYTLLEKLGEGGMGTVYRAKHVLLRRPTAVKLLPVTRSSSAAVARFESEVQLTSSLTHPNTVVVYDYGHSPEGVFYYAMEYIDGITLQDLVEADGPQPPARVIDVLVQICSALAEAHGIGLVHRDVKPSNIMLCDRGGLPDFVKVLDFGLAKDLSGDQSVRVSQSMTLVGTPLYIAPEVALGRGPIDARVDIYALGAVAYFMLAGSPVFSGATVLEVCAKHLSGVPEPLSERLGRPVVPAELEALIMQCLAKDPAARPASAEALADALRALRGRGWDMTEARTWWRDRGRDIEQRLRTNRAAMGGEPSGRTLEIDHHRHAQAGRRSQTADRA